MDVSTPLIADGEAAKLIEPGESALNYPTMAPKPSAGVHALAGDANLDPAAVQEATAARDVLGLVRVQLRGTFAGPTAGTLDWRDRVDQFLEDDTVVTVGAGDARCERRPAPVGNNMALRARFAAIRRIRAGRLAPFFAGMLALSRQARSQSIWSAWPNWSRRVRWSRSQTPASCQSRNLRQQVMPDPQPSSGGSISQGMPDFRTKMMPTRHDRSGMRGRPPFGFGGSFGSNGSTIVHNSSLTSGLLIPRGPQAPFPGFVRRSK
jgi:hypothetical protein